MHRGFLGSKDEKEKPTLMEGGHDEERIQKEPLRLQLAALNHLFYV
jgi:hypothetical protein